MIVILEPDIRQGEPKYTRVISYLEALPGISIHTHEITGEQQHLCEIYLVGNTASLNPKDITSISGVDRVVRISKTYCVLGRHGDQTRTRNFNYNGVTFGQDSFHVFAGLCAVDNPTNVEAMMRALKERGQQCTRMGAYKPRTNPYSFQGHGKSCLPWVFELAGKYDIKVIAMEVTHEEQVNEINEALKQTGNATGVMLQIGTRNTQNFELLKAVGRQTDLPVLIKRGFGITLEESINAAEYLASAGNKNVIFCLRGMKSNLGDPHRNFVDFTHVPVVKRLTMMPVCVDPSHSVGSRESGPDAINDIVHATSQGIIAGANMVLVDFHPAPPQALVDGPQALTIDELDWFLEDCALTRQVYLDRVQLRQKLVKT